MDREVFLPFHVAANCSCRRLRVQRHGWEQTPSRESAKADSPLGACRPFLKLGSLLHFAVGTGTSPQGEDPPNSRLDGSGPRYVDGRDWILGGARNGALRHYPITSTEPRGIPNHPFVRYPHLCDLPWTCDPVEDSARTTPPTDAHRYLYTYRAAFGRIPIMHAPLSFYGGIDGLILLGPLRDLALRRRIHAVYLIAIPLLVAGQTAVSEIFLRRADFWIRIAHRLLG